MEKLNHVKETDVYFLVIDATEVYEFNSEMYFYLIKYPAETILLFDQIINEIFIKDFVNP